MGTYNVADESPILPISIRKQYDNKGKGNISILNGSSNDPFGNGFAFGGNGFGQMFNNDIFQGLMDQPFQMNGDFNLIN